MYRFGLMARKSDTDTAPSKDNTLRQGIAIVVAILVGFMLLAASHTGWIVTTVLDRDIFVATLEDLPADPAVATALAQEVSAGIIDSFEVQDKIADTGEVIFIPPLRPAS
jgi:Ni/Fe-hydrogenase subunit HybB-like protein